ncbi:sugar transferase, partial [Caminibacter sp.]
EFLEKEFKKIYVPRKSEKHFPKVRGYTKFQYFQKRVVDFITGGALFVLALPIMAYSAYRIKKESPDAGIFYTQYRIGKDGKKFKCYKFRSMRTDVEFFSHYTEDDDPRIFPWGAFMRKTRIDELPQLINVFKGEMHMIGPRAEWDELVKKYEETFPFYHERHKVAPGITGWAQVNYPYGRDIEDTRQKLMYDLYYIKDWNLWLEIKIILKTIAVIVRKKGL